MDSVVVFLCLFFLLAFSLFCLIPSISCLCCCLCLSFRRLLSSSLLAYCLSCCVSSLPPLLLCFPRRIRLILLGPLSNLRLTRAVLAVSLIIVALTLFGLVLSPLPSVVCLALSPPHPQSNNHPGASSSALYIGTNDIQICRRFFALKILPRPCFASLNILVNLFLLFCFHVLLSANCLEQWKVVSNRRLYSTRSLRSVFLVS
jgi:hypothetical protein